MENLERYQGFKLKMNVLLIVAVVLGAILLLMLCNNKDGYRKSRNDIGQLSDNLSGYTKCKLHVAVCYGSYDWDIPQQDKDKIAYYCRNANVPMIC
jgi:hypothetical protein